MAVTQARKATSTGLFDDTEESKLIKKTAFNFALQKF